SFTGGTDTGRRIGAVAAEKIMPVSLELGGKSPTIVFPDADLEQAVAGLLFGIFSSCGQSCIAGSRVFIHADVYDRVLDELARRGKWPSIVFLDPDLERAAAGLLSGLFSASGQSCISGSRVFIHAGVYDRVLVELVRRTEKLRVGPGADPETQVAPLVTRAHRDRVAAMVDRARDEGARVLCGGRVPEGGVYDGGAYYLP